MTSGTFFCLMCQEHGVHRVSVTVWRKSVRWKTLRPCASLPIIWRAFSRSPPSLRWVSTSIVSTCRAQGFQVTADACRNRIKELGGRLDSVDQSRYKTKDDPAAAADLRAFVVGPSLRCRFLGRGLTPRCR